MRNLISSCNAFIVDEAHVASVVIEELGKQAKNAYYRLGLSGTPWRMDNQEIRIEGTLGRKIIEVSASDLIELGFLVPPKIFVCNVSEKALKYTLSFDVVVPDILTGQTVISPYFFSGFILLKYISLISKEPVVLFNIN